MAAPADTAKAADTRRAARRAERPPSGGWRTIMAKELADHLGSVRFFVLLIVVALAAIVPMYFISTDISAAAPQVAGQPALFLVLFIGGSDQVGGVPMIALAALLVPLVGIAFGFDGINSERAQGTLSRLLAQPIHRDDVINGKFAAGIAVITLMLGALVVLVTALGIVRLGIIPAPEELARVGVWLLATVLYASFWLAFALLLSVVIRGPASAALVGLRQLVRPHPVRPVPAAARRELPVPARRPRRSGPTPTRRPSRRRCSCGSRPPSCTTTSCAPS